MGEVVRKFVYNLSTYFMDGINRYVIIFNLIFNILYVKKKNKSFTDTLVLLQRNGALMLVFSQGLDIHQEKEYRMVEGTRRETLSIRESLSFTK